MYEAGSREGATLPVEFGCLEDRDDAPQEQNLLERFNVPHDQRYIFQPVEPD